MVINNKYEIHQVIRIHHLGSTNVNVNQGSWIKNHKIIWSCKSIFPDFLHLFQNHSVLHFRSKHHIQSIPPPTGSCSLIYNTAQLLSSLIPALKVSKFQNNSTNSCQDVSLKPKKQTSWWCKWKSQNHWIHQDYSF